MRHILALFVTALLFSQPSAFAEEVTFVKEYSYQAGEADSKLSARAIALEQVKRLLLEELGTYLISETEVKNFQLTKDKITTLSAGIVATQILEDKWNGEVYYLKAKIKADPKEVTKAIDNLRKDKEKDKELEDSKKRADEAFAELTRLRKELEILKAGQKDIGAIKAESQKQTQYAAAADYLLGISLLREKSYKEAISHLIKVYPSRASEAEMNYNIGLAYAGAGEPQKAFQHYMKVEEINAAEARDKYRLDLVFYNLGIAYQKEGNLDEALKAYQEAIRINPEQANADCAKGDILYQKKDYDSALESLTICREKNPERKNVNRYISAIYQSKGIDLLNRKDYAGARIELEQGVTSDPTNETAHYYIGYMEYLTGNYTKALEALDKIKKTEKEEMKKALSNMFYNIGAAMQKKEDWQGAITAFSRAIEINSADPDLHFFLGYSYMKAKKSDLALEAYKEALRLNPKHQGAALNLEKIVTVGKNRDTSQ